MTIEFTIHHGGGDWRFSVWGPLLARMKTLEGLNHRFLCDFSEGAFEIRPGSPDWVFHRVLDYLKSRPGKEEAEYLRCFAGHEVFHVEVVQRLWWHFRPLDRPATWNPDDPWQPDPKYISAYHRWEWSRDRAWRRTLRYGRTVGIDDSAWRKCHTEHYWAWFAPGLQDQP